METPWHGSGKNGDTVGWDTLGWDTLGWDTLGGDTLGGTLWVEHLGWNTLHVKKGPQHV